jgi:GH24 family phage-related lysozyme (muramidase)
MSNFREAISLICKYEGFSEKAFPADDEGTFSIGYGTQYYPDGSPVKQGQWCTKEKALENFFVTTEGTGVYADIKAKLETE